MKANPGGQIETKAVVGRDRLISHLWQIIQQQSVVMTAERRIGKTTVIKKMLAEPADGWKPVFQDLEWCHSAADFAMAVYKEVHHFLSAKGRAARRLREFFQNIGGAEVGGLFRLPDRSEKHWKDILIKAVEDLVHENDESGTKLLFLWDEVPYMLANIRDREGEQTAMEVLDLLRALRQTHGGIRMVLTGSIGVHHVLASLRDKNYANAPKNDMASVEVEPLDEPDAVDLARLLIEGEFSSPSELGAAVTIAHEADCFPFYIHHVVRALKIRGLPPVPGNVTAVVASQLVDPNDPWELRHYRERIPIYYGKDERAVLVLLDELTVKDQASPGELIAVLKGAGALDDRERMLRLLSLMERDHYLKRDAAGSYRFRFPLIRRWWKISRGL